MAKPNILLVIADQLTPFLTGAYGHPVVKTPHLNRLACEGITFNAAYSPCPVCAPARAAMMTGRYVSNIGAYDNAASFSSEEPTLAHYMTLMGYDTVLSGKMHFIGPDQLHGYSRRFTTNVYPADFSWVPDRGLDHQREHHHARNYVAGAIKVGGWNQFLSADEETHFRAIQYLRAKGVRRAGNKPGGGQPFFLTVSYHHPHEPFWPPKYYWDLYEDAEIEIPNLPENFQEMRSTLDNWLNTYHGIQKAPELLDPASLRYVRRAYYALVTYIDDKLGELLSILSETGFAENTLVIFTSDHGDMLGEHGMVQKRAFYEWSSRVPLIIRYPTGIGAGQQVNTPVNLVDISPTLLDLVGFPEKDRFFLDGRSFSGLMEGKNEENRATFSEYHSQGSHAPCFMMRKGRFKYIYIYGYESQLFDLTSDPGEWNNLANQPGYHEVALEMKDAILSHFDPDAINAAVQASICRRRLVKKAMEGGEICWDIEPKFDPRKGITDQYLPGEGFDTIPR